MMQTPQNWCEQSNLMGSVIAIKQTGQTVTRSIIYLCLCVKKLSCLNYERCQLITSVFRSFLPMPCVLKQAKNAMTNKQCILIFIIYQPHECVGVVVGQHCNGIVSIFFPHKSFAKRGFIVLYIWQFSILHHT